MGRIGPRRLVRAALRASLHRVLGVAPESALDRRLPNSTREKVPSAGLGAAGQNAVHAVEYAPTSALTLHLALSRLPESLNDHVFVDFGAGKGRVLLLAAERPFKAVTGVEFSPELHRQAVENIAQAGQEGRVNCVLADAATFDLPPEPCVLYFYNPFGEPVMRAVLDNIRQSHERLPRPMHLVYVNPVLGDLFARQPFLIRLPIGRGQKVLQALLGDHETRVYRVRSLDPS